MSTTKVFSSVIRLRRDNDFNYAKIADTFVPASGEVCLVDTNKGLKAKVGDGVSTYSQLAYTDTYLEAQMRDLIVRGYFFNGKFYKDELHTEEISGYAYKLFIDIPNNAIYSWADGVFINLSQSVDIPYASSTTPGIMRLYQESGNNEDGTMSQKAISLADANLSERINTKVTAEADASAETLYLKFN